MVGLMNKDIDAEIKELMLISDKLDYKEEIKTLKKELEDGSKSIHMDWSDYENEIEELKKENIKISNNAHHDIDSLENEQEKFSLKIKKLKKENEKLEKMINEYKIRVQTLYAHAEQNEKLKKELEDGSKSIHMDWSEYENDIEKLKKENKKLKKENKKLKKITSS